MSLLSTVLEGFRYSCNRRYVLSASSLTFHKQSPKHCLEIVYTLLRVAFSIRCCISIIFCVNIGSIIFD